MLYNTNPAKKPQNKKKQTNNLSILETNITGTYWFQYYYCSKLIKKKLNYYKGYMKKFKQVTFERYIQLEWWGFTVEVYTISISAFGVHTHAMLPIRKCCNDIPLPGYFHLQSSLNELHVVIAQTCQCIGTLMLM